MFRDYLRSALLHNTASLFCTDLAKNSETRNIVAASLSSESDDLEPRFRRGVNPGWFPSPSSSNHESAARLGAIAKIFRDRISEAAHYHHHLAAVGIYDDDDDDDPTTTMTMTSSAIMQTMIRLFSHRRAYLKVASGLRRVERADREKEKGQRRRDGIMEDGAGDRPKGNKDFCALTCQDRLISQKRIFTH